MSARAAVTEAGHRRVSLMATCLCDAFFDDVAQATVEVLEYLGCEVAFPEDQTCCAQPAFNAGEWDSARRVARHTLDVFRGDDAVVVPSGSCARMVDHGALLLFENEPDRPAVEGLAHRTWELCDFIVRGLGVTTLAGALEGCAWRSIGRVTRAARATRNRRWRCCARSTASRSCRSAKASNAAASAARSPSGSRTSRARWAA